MKSYSKYINQNIIRWDFATKYKPFNCKEILEINKLTINLHESSLVNKKDKYILSFFTELITNQRVSPSMISNNSYKNSLVIKKIQSSVARAQVTLRKNQMFFFIDKWISLSLPKAFQFSGYKNLGIDINNGTSFYFDDIFSFIELEDLQSLVYKCNGLQFQVDIKKSKFLKLSYIDLETDNIIKKKIVNCTEYLLASMSIPIKSEGIINNRNYPNLNFFNL